MSCDAESIDELRRVMGEPSISDALRREHAADLVAAIEHVGASGLVRPWLLAHAAELRGDLAGALKQYLDAIELALGCPSAQEWLQLKVHVIRGWTGEAHVRGDADAASLRALARADALGDRMLVAHVASARAALLLDRAASGAAPRELQDLAALLEAATIDAESAIETARGRARVELAETFGQLYMDMFRTLIRGDLAGAIPRGRERAWAWFRALRQTIDLCHSDGDDSEDLSEVPDGTAVLEFLAPPGDALQVCLSYPPGRGARVYGTFELAAARISQAQFELGERHRRILDAGATTADTVIDLCEWTHESAERWSELLLQTPITWSDTMCCTLDERLARDPVGRLCVLPHGPVHLAPWGLLRSPGAPAWVERYALVICASWRPSPRTATRGSGVVRKSIPLAVDELACWPTSDQAGSLFSEIAGAEKAWIAGHGTFLPPTHGDSRLSTAGIGEVLSLGLRALLDEAILVRETSNCAPRSMALSICEAGEVSRRALLSEGVTIARAFLAAGSTWVLAPKWSTTNLSDAFLSARLADARPLPEIARELLVQEFARWRSGQDREGVRLLAQECLARGWLPLSDVGALEVHGYIEERA